VCADPFRAVEEFVSLREKLRTMLVCAFLEVGVLSGVPMRPEEIRALLSQMNQPSLAHVLPADEESGDDPPEDGNL